MKTESRLIAVPVNGDEIRGDLHIPEKSTALVVFAHLGVTHASSSSPRHRLPGLTILHQDESRS